MEFLEFLRKRKEMTKEEEAFWLTVFDFDKWLKENRNGGVYVRGDLILNVKKKIKNF